MSALFQMLPPMVFLLTDSIIDNFKKISFGKSSNYVMVIGKDIIASENCKNLKLGTYDAIIQIIKKMCSKGCISACPD